MFKKIISICIITILIFGGIFIYSIYATPKLDNEWTEFITEFHFANLETREQYRESQYNEKIKYRRNPKMVQLIQDGIEIDWRIFVSHLEKCNVPSDLIDKYATKTTTANERIIIDKALNEYYQEKNRKFRTSYQIVNSLRYLSGGVVVLSILTMIIGLAINLWKSGKKEDNQKNS
jgi:hypothetical protein